MNKYKTSSGELISQATIDSRRSKTYRLMYEGEGHPSCCGCGLPAQGSGHYVPQKVCKNLGKAEYCYAPVNIAPLCYKCNSLIESYKSEEVKHLMCYEDLLRVTELIDPVRFKLMTL